MRAAVFHKPGHISYDIVPDPAIEKPNDVILRVTSTAICGSDLHIYNGGFPQVKDLIMGHEFMGVVEETGSAIRTLQKGDRVVVPFPIACGHRIGTRRSYGPESCLAQGSWQGDCH